MRILYLDCFSGISGDMTVGALLDLGLPFDVLKDQLEMLGLPGYRLEYKRGTDGALSASDFTVELLDEAQPPGVDPGTGFAPRLPQRRTAPPASGGVANEGHISPSPAPGAGEDGRRPDEGGTRKMRFSLRFQPHPSQAPEGSPTCPPGILSRPAGGRGTEKLSRQAQAGGDISPRLTSPVYGGGGRGRVRPRSGRVAAEADAQRFRPVAESPGADHATGSGPSHDHTHPHATGSGHSHDHTHAHATGSGHSHDHTHAHATGSGHSHDHAHDGGPAHSHSHGAGAVHRAYRDIRAMIDASPLPGPVKERAQAIFLILARAEGKIHGIPVDEVSFHEVGAIDSIVDIVGAAIGLHYLEIDKLVCSPLPVSRGMVDCQHGLLPLPAPATLELLRGAQVYDSGRTVELVTPTGAAIVAAMASSFGGMPSMTVDRIGYGLGKRRGHATPNALRVVLGEDGGSRRGRHSSPDQAVMIEANIDDMNPQFFEPLLEKLMSEGALDVSLSPVQMKKGRPATLVQVLCEEAVRERMLNILLTESTTIGARFYRVDRTCLERQIVQVSTPFGEMPVKLSSREGQVLNVMPEFEDCRRVAAERNLPLKQVHQEVLRCALEQGFGQVLPAERSS